MLDGVRQAKVAREVAKLGDLPRADLVECWRSVYGAAPPKGIGRPLLERAAGWHVQAKAFGGLKRNSRALLSSLPPRTGERARVPATGDTNVSGPQGADVDAMASGISLPTEIPGTISDASQPGDLRPSSAETSKARTPALPRGRPGPGMRLVREWHGRAHVVDVTATGFLWNGQSYASLSVIARRITGARWSGPRFFGL